MVDGPAVLLRPRHTGPPSRSIEVLSALRHEPNAGEARTNMRRRTHYTPISSAKRSGDPRQPGCRGLLGARED